MQPTDIQWPWYPLELGSVTDLVSILLGLIILGISVWIAVRQFRIMNRQTAMMVEQGEIAKRQEVIAKRQGDIAETQHQIMQEQLAKKSDLRVRARRQLSHGDHISIEFDVLNGGNKTARGFYWEILSEPHLTILFTFRNASGGILEPELIYLSEDESAYRIDGYFGDRLFPGMDIDVASIDVPAAAPDTAEVTIWWRIKGEDGMVPAAGYTQIRFERQAHGLYTDVHDDPYTQTQTS